MADSVARTKDEVLEEVASSGIDPRLVKCDVDFRTEVRDHSHFFVYYIRTRFLHHTKVFGDPK
jgi:hypothetical protein